tara:strand:+ start:527 stop:718 length:192 start_codon:yes stop_codon:yes gene_type:complete
MWSKAIPKLTGTVLKLISLSRIGVLGFFQGLKPRLWRMTLSQAITFGTYEYVLSVVEDKNSSG